MLPFDNTHGSSSQMPSQGQIYDDSSQQTKKKQSRVTVMRIPNWTLKEDEAMCIA